jgi:hypothetical protein
MENLLTSLAFLDAVHDFKKLASETYKNVIGESLPGQIFNIPNKETAIEIASTYAEHIYNVGHDSNEIFTNLGGSATTPIAIVCDASFCSHIIRELEKNTIGKVYFVINREVMLDPGNNMSSIADSNNLYVAKDVDRKTITYPKYVSPENDYVHKFKELHSKFDVSIENEDGKFIFTTKLNNTLIESLKDIEINNSISNLKRIINSAASIDVIKSCFLRKRSGDWLQILSCLDKSRDYLVNGQVKKLRDCIIYFCSSDLIALSFALCCGVNCIIRRDSVYSVYRAREIEIPIEMDPFLKQRRDAVELFHYFRNEKLEETIYILKEGLEEYKKLKSEWEGILMTVDTVDSFDRLKELLVLALHYCTLTDLSTRETTPFVEKFINNPYDDIFSDPMDGVTACWAVSKRAQEYPTTIRRFRHLNIYKTSEKVPYYNDVFKFENTSFESRDMIYGCVLFRTILNSAGSGGIHKTFIIKLMERIMSLLEYDENIVAMYSLFFDVHNLYEQHGGGDPSKSHSITKRVLVRIGDYITENLLADTCVVHFPLSEGHPYTFFMSNIGELMINHLIYKKNIIPIRYIEYVTEMNEEYEENGKDGPYDEIKKFLKRHMQKRRSLQRKKNVMTCKTKIRNSGRFLIQNGIKTRRRRN